MSSAFARPCSLNLAPATRFWPRHSKELKFSMAASPAPRVGGAGDEVVADPGHDCLRRLAAKRGGRRDRDRGLVLGNDALQQDDIAAAALARSGDVAERLEDGAIWGEAKLAGGRRRARLEPEFTGGLDGTEIRRARARQGDRLRRRAIADHDTDCHYCHSELHMRLHPRISRSFQDRLRADRGGTCGEAGCRTANRLGVVVTRSVGQFDCHQIGDMI